jgi:hypothetical protein
MIVRRRSSNIRAPSRYKRLTLLDQAIPPASANAFSKREKKVKKSSVESYFIVRRVFTARYTL